jgi:hypothetical protein
MVGVIDVNSPSQPTQAERHLFFARYPNTFVATADVHTATLEDYERMLSLPEPSKQSFLMGLHPRCGADSAVRRLLEADEPQHIFRRIFKFLECVDVANVKCLVFCHWPPGTTMDTTRDVICRHIDIFQRWRVPPHLAEQEAAAASSANAAAAAANEMLEERTEEVEEADGSTEAAPAAAGGTVASSGEDKTAATDTNGQNNLSRLTHDSAAVPQWVLLGLPMDHIVTSRESADENRKLAEVVEAMKRLRSGRKTGLQPKEQLVLAPHFPNYALLLLKYSTHRDKSRSTSKSSASRKRKSEVRKHAPKHDVVPMPNFGATSTGNEDQETAPPANPAEPMKILGPTAGTAAAQAGGFHDQRRAAQHGTQALEGNDSQGMNMVPRRRPGNNNNRRNEGPHMGMFEQQDYMNAGNWVPPGLPPGLGPPPGLLQGQMATPHNRMPPGLQPMQQGYMGGGYGADSALMPCYMGRGAGLGKGAGGGKGGAAGAEKGGNRQRAPNAWGMPAFDHYYQ